MKEYEIRLEVKTVAHIKAKAYNRNDAMDTAYHMLEHELIKAGDDSVVLSETKVGKILTVKVLAD